MRACIRLYLLCLPVVCLCFCGCGSGAGLDDTSDLVPVTQQIRIVNWNVAGFDDKRWFPTKDQVVATLVHQKVLAIDANVVTLQEATLGMLQQLGEVLGPEWNCYTWSPGLDQLVTCVRGVGSNLEADTLSGTADLPPNERWWGYFQLEYQGVKITNVHTRCGDGDEDGVCEKAVLFHVPELYDIVTSGIVAGDFNHERPEELGWHQTDPDPEHTLRTSETKVDHVLTVEPFLSSWGHAMDEAEPYAEISNHRVLLTGVTLETPR